MGSVNPQPPIFSLLFTLIFIKMLQNTAPGPSALFLAKGDD